MHNGVSRLGLILRPGCKPIFPLFHTGISARDPLVQASDHHAGRSAAGRGSGYHSGSGREPYQDEVPPSVGSQGKRAQNPQQEDNDANRELVFTVLLLSRMRERTSSARVRFKQRP